MPASAYASTKRMQKMPMRMPRLKPKAFVARVFTEGSVDTWHSNV